MDFIIITVAIMSVCSLIAYKLLPVCGMKINLQPLLLCGILALLVNFSAIIVSPYLSPAHFAMVGALIIVSSAVATWYDNWLSSRQSRLVTGVIIPEEPPADEPVQLAEPAPSTPAEADVEEPVPEYVHEGGDDTSSKVLATEFLYDEKPQSSADATTDEAEETPKPEEKTPINNEESSADEVEKVPESAKEPAVETEVEAEPEPEPEPVVEPEPEPEPVIEAVPEPEPEPKPVVEAAPEPEPEPEPEPVVEAAPEPEPEPEPTSAISDDVAAAVAAMETLDDLLDYAFEQKTMGNYPNSLYASAEALRQYRDDSYAPFIAIDMINICKTMGNYTHALELYQDALSLPAVPEDPYMEQEFRSGIKYITCIAEVLSAHGMNNVPLSNIPHDIMSEIEEKYAACKNNS